MIPTELRIHSRNLHFQSPADYNFSETYAVELRKKKRIESISQKRMKSGMNLTLDNINFSVLEDFSKILSGVNYSNSEILKVLNVIKGLVSRPELDFKNLILSDIVYKVIVLAMETDYEIIKESTLILCNLACGKIDIVNHMIERGVVEVLVRVIGIDTEISENAIWAIGNLAAENFEICEIIQNSGFSQELLKYLNNFVEIPSSIAKVSLWTLGNLLCKVKIVLPVTGRNCIEVLNFMKNCIDVKELVVEWIRMASIFLKKFGEAADLVVENHLLSRILKLLEDDDLSVRIFAMEAVGSIAYSNDKNTQILLSFKILDTINFLLYSFPSQNLKLTYWVLSNIAGGTTAQAHNLINHPIIEKILSSLQLSNPDTQNEISFILYNLSLKSCIDDLIHLLDQKILTKIFQVLNFCPYEALYNLLKFILNSILAIIHADRQDLLHQIIETGMLETIEKYRDSKDDKLKKVAGLILMKIKNSF